jgi:RNA-directed DNA polymerase
MPGRSIRTNAEAHQGNTFVYTTDISDFFPTISHERVLALFRRFGWGERVSAQAARLCTHDAHLAQGLVTSLILADQIMHVADRQIAKACAQLGLTYTRYVDDITVSGPFNFKRSGIPALVRRILKYNGFRAKEEKEQFGTLAEGTTVTKVRVLKGGLDVRSEYLTELERQLHDHRELGLGGHFAGPFFTQDQLWGRVEFVSWICPKRRGYLYGLLKRIKWDVVYSEAFTRGLVARVRSVVKQGQRESLTA